MGASQRIEDMQGLGLLFMDEGARCEGFVMGRIKKGGEAREMEEPTHRFSSLGTGFDAINSF